ncbi:protein AHNAK2 [Thomomys bottae]
MCDCFHVVLPTWPGAPGRGAPPPACGPLPGAETDPGRPPVWWVWTPWPADLLSPGQAACVVGVDAQACRPAVPGAGRLSGPPVWWVWTPRPADLLLELSPTGVGRAFWLCQELRVVAGPVATVTELGLSLFQRLPGCAHSPRDRGLSPRHGLHSPPPRPVLGMVGIPRLGPEALQHGEAPGHQATAEAAAVMCGGAQPASSPNAGTVGAEAGPFSPTQEVAGSSWLPQMGSPVDDEVQRVSTSLPAAIYQSTLVGRSLGAGKVTCRHGSSPGLQPGGPGRETQEDDSESEGPEEGTLRPRPQGSSPVYEWVTEGAGFGAQGEAPGGRRSSGRRRSWWKRHSDDSDASSMSHPQAVQETTEVTLKTEVEAGASGYSVTGGGAQGIFVQQVLKGSSAAKLFSLRAGDQLLSATIFFDDIKYEDALKILQYSEPFKVQFSLRRRLPAGDEEQGAVPQRGGARKEEQDAEAVDGYTKTLEADGDRERLLSTPRGGRGRRSQDRFSWPKFQAIKSQRVPGPRRSRSSSEAHERPGAQDASPGSTDTLRHSEPLERVAPGGRRKRCPLHLRLRRSSEGGPAGRAARGQGCAGVLEQREPGEDELQDTEMVASGRQESRTQMQEATPAQTTSLAMLGEEEPREGEGRAARRARKTQDAADTQGVPGAHTALETSRQDKWDGMQNLRDSTEEVDARRQPGEAQVRIRHLNTPKFVFSEDKGPETQRGSFAHEEHKREQRSFGEEASGPRGPAGVGAASHCAAETEQEEGSGPGEPTRQGVEDMEGAEPDRSRGPRGMKMQTFKMPSFSWSPTKDGGTSYKKQIQEKEKQTGERKGEQHMIMKLDPIKDKDRNLKNGSKTQTEIIKKQKENTSLTEENDSINKDGMGVDIQAPGVRVDRALTLGDRAVHTKDSKFRKPKFKMPSFGVSPPSEPSQGILDVMAAKVQDDIGMSSDHGELKTPEVSIQLPSAELESKANQMTVKLPEGDLPGQPIAASLKGHLPQVQMPKVDLKGPEMDIKGPKLDVKGPTAESGIPEVEVSLSTTEVDIPAPSANLGGDLTLGDRDVAAKDSKFRMPKFKMPSFGVSAPRKSMEGSIEVSAPKVQVDVDLPSAHGEVKTPEVSIQLPSAELESKARQMIVKLPEGDRPGQSIGARLKAQQPTVQMPSLKMPRVDLKGPQVDTKGPKLDVKGPTAEAGSPELEVSLSSVEVDIQTPDLVLKRDPAPRDMDVDTKDGKFKMTKFKMPSFGVSVPGRPSEASVEVSAPKMQGVVDLSSIHGGLKTPEVSIQLPSAELEAKAGQMAVKLPEGDLPGQPIGASLKGHLPKVQMPKVDLKGPEVDIKGPKLDVKGPTVESGIPEVDVSLSTTEVDIPAPSANLGGYLTLGDRDVATKDSKFRMPKFKMPSFGVSTPRKSLEGEIGVSLPKVQGDMDLPSAHGELTTPEGSGELPSADLETKAGQVAMKLPEGQLPKGEPTIQPGVSLKGQLPTVQMPSLKMPRVDLQGPQVDIKIPKLDFKGPRGEAGTPEVELSLPSVELDMQTTDVKPEDDQSQRDEDLDTKDGKFTMPKVKMPLFGATAASKPGEGEMELSVPKVQGDVSLPSIDSDLKTPEVSAQLPSADLEAKAGQVAVKLPKGDLPGQPKGASLKGHLPKVQMPSLKMPRVDLKDPKLDVKGPTVEAGSPELEVSLPTTEVEIQAPSANLEGDLTLGDRDVATKDNKFRMPKFKMPSFAVSTPRKSLEGEIGVSVPKVQVDVDLPSAHGEVKTPEVSIQLPSAELEAKTGQMAVKLPEGDLPGQPKGASLKGHLPKVHMPSLKMPRVDLKGPEVDTKGPKLDVKGPTAGTGTSELEVSLLRTERDIQALSANLEGDLTPGDRDVAAKDSKFRMPKFKMPSFGVSTPRKSLEGEIGVSVPKVQVDVDLPSAHGEVKTPEVSIQLPSAELEAKTGQMAVKLPEGDLPGQPKGASLKGHLPKVHMPSLKMPRVDLKGPQVESKGPKLDVKGPTAMAGTPNVEVSLPIKQVDIQAHGAMLEGSLDQKDKDLETKDSKFRIPRFKMPTFEGAAPRKSMRGSIEVSTPKVLEDMDLTSSHGELKTPEVSIQLPSAELEAKTGQMAVKLPEGDLPGQSIGASLKGHLPKVQMPSLKMPRVDLKGPKLDVKGPKATEGVHDLDVALPSVELDIRAPIAQLEGDLAHEDQDVTTKDSKFKRPKLKVPSIGVTSERKSSEGSTEVTAHKGRAVDVASIHGEMKTPEVSIQLPSAELEATAAQVAVKLVGVELPEEELPDKSTGARLKGHLPKVQMPSLKMPRVDLKDPKLDVKGPTAEAGSPELGVSLPTTEVEIQAPSANLEGDLTLGDRDVATKDNKFRMPKFKMPSFAVSTPRKSLEGEIGVSVPKVQVDVDLPSAHGEVKTPEVSIQLPSAELEAKTGQMAVKLPEGDLPGQSIGASLKGHLPKVHMPSLKMPRVDLKGPEVDIKGPKLDVRGPTGGTGTSELEVSLLRTERDIQAPSANVEGDLTPGDRDVAAKDSKFRMPKFKMPSFGVSTPRKSLEGEIGVSLPKVQGDMDLPSAHGELTTPEGSGELPSADLETKAGQVAMKLPEGQLPKGEPTIQPGVSLKDQLPTVQMPSLKMPRVDLQGPQVDIKIPKLDFKGPRGEAGTPEVELSLPSVELDMQTTDVKPEDDQSQRDEDLDTKDGKFTMPKVKMPLFGATAASKPGEGEMELSVPKVQGDVSLPSIDSDLKTPEVSAQLPSADLEAKAGQVAVKLPKGDLPGQPKGASLKGHLPKVQMPSLKMPRVDLKDPKLDVKGPTAEAGSPELGVSLPTTEVEIQAPSANLEGDLTLGDRDVATKDNKFRMPKFKMPSFAVSTPRKSLEGEIGVSVPKVQVDVDLPSAHGEVKTPEVSIQLPSAELEAKTGQMIVKLPEGDLPGQPIGASLKGHLPKVQMPKVDLKGPEVDTKGPKLDVNGPTAESGTPELEVSLPTTEVDILAPSANLEGDLTLGDRDVATKDSKFRMPKFKMPSFGVSTPRKSLEGEIGVSVSKVQADMDLPSAHGELTTPEGSGQLPSADLETKAGQVAMKLPEGQLPKGEPTIQPGVSLKDQLPTVQMPSLKMPRVDLQGPQVDIKGPKVEGDTPELEVSLPITDIQVPGPKVEGPLAQRDKDLDTKASKFRMPKFKMPSFGVSASRKSTEGSIEVSASKVQDAVALSSAHSEVKTPEVSIQLPSAELEAKASQVAMQLPKAQLPGGQLSDQSFGASLEGQLPTVQVSRLTMLKVDLQGPQEDTKGSKLAVKGPKATEGIHDLDMALPSVEQAIRAPIAHPEGDLAHGDQDVTTKDSKFKRPKVEMPSSGASGSGPALECALVGWTPQGQGHACVPSVQGGLKTPEVSRQPPPAELEAQAHQLSVSRSEEHFTDRFVPPSHFPISFPKFHEPRFIVRSPDVTLCDIAAVPVMEPTSDIPLASGQHPCSALSVSTHADGSSGVPACDIPVCDIPVERVKSSPRKLPQFKLPSFSLSSKKGLESPGSHESSADAPTMTLPPKSDQAVSQPCAQVSHAEASSDISSDKDGEKGRAKKPGLAFRRLSLPKLRVSKGQASLPQGGAGTALPRGLAAGDPESSEKGTAEDVALGAGMKEGLSEGFGVNLQVAELCTPSLGFAKPGLRASTAKMEMKPWKADLPLPDSKGPEPEDISASQSHGEGTVLTPEDPLQFSCRQPEAAPAMGPEEGAGGEAPADEPERWLTTPKFRLPGFGRSASQGQEDTPAAAPEVAAAAGSQTPQVPQPKVGTEVSPAPPEWGLAVTALSRSACTHVQRADSPSTDLELSTSEATAPSTEGLLPAQPPGGGRSEREGGRGPLPGPGGLGLASAEQVSPQPAGPLKLRVSQTHVPAQISVVRVEQLWEESVLTARVPTSSGPTPGREAEFSPRVRDAEAEACAMGGQGRPGLRGARPVRAYTRDTGEGPADPSSEAPPISKVKVHILGAQGESQEAVACRREPTQERPRAAAAAAETFSTPIVTQIPSYGFSLVKVKAQAGMYTGALEGLAEALTPAVPGGPQPEVAERCEMGSVSAHLPGPHALSPGEPPSLRLAHSGSDEEPTAILECPQDSQEVRAPPAGEDGALKEKPGSKKSSGVLWSWLPSVGFPSFGERSAEPGEDVGSPTPIQTQPGAGAEADLPRKHEKPGWFHLPKLGFSSPTQKSSQDRQREAQRRQEETATFFDARESFSPEGEEEEGGERAAGAEQDGNAPGPWAE